MLACQDASRNYLLGNCPNYRQVTEANRVFKFKNKNGVSSDHDISIWCQVSIISVIRSKQTVRRPHESAKSAQRPGGRDPAGRADVARSGGTGAGGECRGVAEELEGPASAGRRGGADDRAASAHERGVEADSYPGAI